ncbi:sugar porter family MFS transporter [Streptomyces fractus]|uniref:sugar porter family MFS transporter n=1 Tax=Streptomyces fractus TaxID=641806 RepID=UPI003CF94F6E
MAGTQARTGSRPAAGEHLGHVIFIAAAAAMGGFLFGYDASVINGATMAIQDQFSLSSGQLAQVVATSLLGCAVGAALAGRMADRIGRIRVMQISAVLFAVSAVGSALCFGAWDLVLWRVLGGLATGMASVIGPAYIAEVAPPAYRGRLASFQQAAIVLGIATSQLVNWAIIEAADGQQRGQIAGLEAWQWMLAVMVVPAVVYGLLSFAIPESPRFLVSVGRLTEARRVLADIEAAPETLDARVHEIQQSLKSDHKPTFKDLRDRNFGLKPVVWIGIGLAAFQQLVGINVIFYYSSMLWQSVGIDPSSSFFYSFETSLVNIVGTVIAMTLVDRIGRRPLLLFGSVGMTLSLAVCAWAFSYQNAAGILPSLQGTVALIAANVFVLCFATSWGVVMWVLLGEMFPSRIRAAALGLGAAVNWIANWLVTVTFPGMSEWNLSLSYIFYAVFAGLSILFVLKFVPETKGKALEEMG